MIDPFNITDFNRTDADLQEFWLFSICVAGKGADQQSKKLDAFLSGVQGPLTPFQKVQWMIDQGILEERLKDHRLGQYSRITKSFEQSLQHDLRTATLQQLESIFGVSYKTSRFFIMHSRPDVKIAALDTHILKYLNANGVEAPKNTPSSSKQYAELEQHFLRLAESSGMSLAEFDLAIWTQYARPANEGANV